MTTSAPDSTLPRLLTIDELTPKRKYDRLTVDTVNDEEVILPSALKKRKVDVDGRNPELEIKKKILDALNKTKEAPAKVDLSEPLRPNLVELLKNWASSFHYVLLYKVRTVRVDDIPGDVRHEGRDVQVYKIRLYWS